MSKKDKTIIEDEEKVLDDVLEGKEEDDAEKDEMDTDTVKKKVEKKDKSKETDSDDGESDDGESDDGEPEDGEDEDKKEVDEKSCGKKPMKESYEQLAKDSASAIFEDTDLSEDFKGKAETIMEAAIASAVAEQVAETTANLQEEFEEKYSQLEEKISEQVDEYTTYVVESWIEENKVEVERGLRVAMAEEFIADFTSLLEKHNITLADENIDAFESAQTEISDLKEKVADLTESLISEKKKSFEFEKQDVIDELSEDLADTQKEKFLKLVEDVEAKSLETFKDKAKIVRESFFKNDKEETKETIIEDTSKPKVKHASMSAYINSSRKFNQSKY
jgi:hypothetical protein